MNPVYSNPRRSRPNSSMYWSRIERQKPKTSQSFTQNIKPTSQKVRLQSSKSSKSKETSKSIGKELNLKEFRLLHRQTKHQHRLIPPCGERVDQKYVVKGSAIWTPKKEKALILNKQFGNHNQVCAPTKIEILEIEEEKFEKTALKPKAIRSTSRLKNFAYEDLNPNYLIDQYYFTRKALNKRHSYPDFLEKYQKKEGKSTRRKSSDERYTPTKVDMKKINDTERILYNNVPRARGYKNEKPVFFKEYYTETMNLDKQIQSERKVKIWIEKCQFQIRAAKSDIANAWTNRI
jgi:hypothetical protein